MTDEESRKLKTGVRVYWRGNAEDAGRITETSWDAVAIAWDNGQIARVHYNDMSEVQLKPIKQLTKNDRGY